jgi:hypothetical protein
VGVCRPTSRMSRSGVGWLMKSMRRPGRPCGHVGR